MRVQLLVWIGLAACGSGPAGVGIPDAGSDACVPWECFASVACSNAQAYRTGGGELPCERGMVCALERTTCSAGCALDVSVPGGFEFTGDVSALCAETPAAAIGDSCEHQCLPTRAAIAADGTVTQQYLACVDDPSRGTSACAAAPAPVVDSYLQACSAYQLSDARNRAGVDGVIDDDCLVAWDGATLHAGSTFRCLGDWDCPDGSLCDDQLFYAGDPDRSPGVCKPGGPRGVIDPALLPAA
jgi:hypothetical protein